MQKKSTLFFIVLFLCEWVGNALPQTHWSSVGTFFVV
jgi:hypothetical protein